MFNNKNISDNTKVTNFYALKAHTPYQSPLLYFGQNDKNKEQQPKVAVVTENNMIKHLFTGDVAANKCGDCKEGAPPPSKVSNLLNNPHMNNKYDDAWFLKQNP